MLQIEKIKNMESSALKRWLKKEFAGSERHGDANTVMKAGASSEIMYGVLDISKMIAELTGLLLKYPDFQIETEKPRLMVKGRMKGEPQKMADLIRLGLLHNTDIDMVIASVGDSSVFYCNQLEFIYNLVGVFGVQLALLIQDDEEMKRFYLEYLEWLEPYYEQGMEKKQSFSKILAHSVGKLAMQYPEELATIMPKGFNVPYFVNRLRHILEAYHLPDINAPSEWKLMGFTITRDDVWLSCHIDFRTFNGLMILFGTDERVEKPRVLNEKQVVQMAENLLLLMLQTDDTVSRLFAKDLSNVIAEMLKLGTDTDPAAAAEALQKYVEVFYF